MIRSVWLDLDNTLLDFDAYAQQAMREGFARFGFYYEPWMFAVFQEETNALWEAVGRGEMTREALEAVRWDRIFRRLGTAGDGAAFECFFKEGLLHSAILEPGARDLLCALSAKYPLCLASNGPVLQQTRRLEAGGLRGFFTHLFLSEDLGAFKPAREFFERALKRQNAGLSQPLAPNEILMLGDSVSSDIEGAAAFGMKTCFYRRGRNLSPAAADFCIDDLKEAIKAMRDAR